MKRIAITLLAILAFSVQGMAQKYLDIYQNGVVTKSISTADIDSVSITETQPRIIKIWRDGNAILTYTSTDIDCIKVSREGDEPLVYLGVVGFNQELYTKPIDILATSTATQYKTFIDNLPRKDGTLLYYAVDNALDMLENQQIETPIKSVNLVTFTDGLDQGSIMMSSKYGSSNEYLTALSKRIAETKIKGLPINAYSVGLRGSDVVDEIMFKNNLTRLASSKNKAFEVNSMSDVNERLQAIADQINSINTHQTISVKIPGTDSGTLIRFTFDGLPANESQLYIEGIFYLQDRSLHNVSYHGIRANSGSIVQGTQNGIFITYTFTGLQREDENGLIPTNDIRQYYRMTSSSLWQVNSEFSPTNSTQRNISHSSSAIVLALDCSNSLGEQIKEMKEHAVNLIANVGGLDESDFVEDHVGVHKTDPYDPSKPVTITSFTPESGGLGQQIVINGSNFGNDVDKVKVTIGGKPAVLVSVMSDCLYCYVPGGAFTGVIEVTVGDETTGTQTARAATNFNYERKMVVGKLCGYKTARDDQGWKDGPFETCAGFRNDGVMQFSPYNHDQLFIVYDQEPYFGTVAHGIQLLDLKERTVQTILPLSKFNNQRLRTIDFCVDPFAYDEYGNWLGRAEETWSDTDYQDNRKTRWSEHLIISADNYSSNYEANSVYIVDRDQNGDFSSNSVVTPLANYNQCNGASIHPNGELYFTSYTQGQVLRLDMNTYWDCIEAQKIGERDGTDPRFTKAWDPSVNTNKFGGFKKLFKMPDFHLECQIDIHPTGKYAYIIVINRQCIYRTDYDEVNKEFLPPYLVAGTWGTRGFVNGVGKSAKFSRPCQGTFVKNDAYEADGKSDIYDFYICDNSWDRDHTGNVNAEAHAIRLLTPEGIVKTYAGGNAATHADGKPFGSENGELRDVARFDRPTGLVNDFHIDKITGEKTLIFYILDTMNRCIRTITMEEPED